MAWTANSRIAIGLGALLVVTGATLAANPPNVVSQAGRTFKPNEISIKRGDTVQFVNDDGDLLHHVYVESDKMSFDSGDQKPGSRTDVQFTVAGDFMVLCAIHPKMKLMVRVQ